MFNDLAEQHVPRAMACVVINASHQRRQYHHRQLQQQPAPAPASKRRKQWGSFANNLKQTTSLKKTAVRIGKCIEKQLQEMSQHGTAKEQATAREEIASMVQETLMAQRQRTAVVAKGIPCVFINAQSQSALQAKKEQGNNRTEDQRTKLFLGDGRLYRIDNYFLSLK